jgi:hypothetical protein
MPASAGDSLRTQADPRITEAIATPNGTARRGSTRSTANKWDLAQPVPTLNIFELLALD